jgi:FkbM family methyltransferase
MLAILKRLFDKLGLGNPQKTKGIASGVESDSKANGSNAGDVADGDASKVESITPVDPTQAPPISDQEVRDTLVAFDENLLEKARTQWQFGDWETLAGVSREQLQHHPDRAKLALLVAAGHCQLGSMQQARQFTRLADDWGVSKKLISQVLISGVHNSLALANATTGRVDKLLTHTEKSVRIGSPNSDINLIKAVRLSNLPTLTPEKKQLLNGLNIEKLQSKVMALESKLKNEREINHTLQNKISKQNEKTGKDDDIAEFIADITPFLLNKKITYVDVGAHTGAVFCKFFDSKINIREAHLYEPNSSSFLVLKNNIKEIKKISSMRVRNIALGSSKGIGYYTDAKSMTRIHRETNKKNNDEVKKVEIETLDNDSVFITDARIDLLKLDVEGFELEVLNGAKKLLEDQKISVIYVELGFSKSNTQQTFFESVVNFLDIYGYQIFRIYEQKQEWMVDSPVLRRANFAFMSQKFSTSHPYSVVDKIARLNNIQE